MILSLDRYDQTLDSFYCMVHVFAVQFLRGTNGIQQLECSLGSLVEGRVSLAPQMMQP